jgi:tyrosine-protein kinase Etk/Wzc
MTFDDIVHTILLNRNPILKITIVTSILVFLILLFIYPITYKAPVTILPPSDQDQMGGLRGLISGGEFSSLLLGGGLTQSSSQLQIEILKSRTAAEHVVRKHNLMDYYDSKTFYNACNDLRDDLEIELSKEKIITLSVKVSTGFLPSFLADLDSTKKFSAKLSNSYVEALDKINSEKISYKAKRAREYIEEQLQITKEMLITAEEYLMEFQKENKTISLPEQLRAAIESSSQLKAELIKTEIEIGLLETNLREDSPALVSVRKKLSELKQEYDKFEIGTEDYLLAFEDVPELSKEFADLLREVKIQNEIYLLLQQQYYKEKIQENRDLPTIEVLDEAIPPLRASAPRLIYSTILSGIFTFLLVSLYFILRDRNLFPFKRKNKT